MYTIGDYVVHQKDVCKVIDIKEKYIKDIDYYILEPINDPSLKVKVPTNSSKIRNIISIEKANDIIKNIINIEKIKVDDKNIENEYKKLFNTGLHEDLVKIIKTTYLRNKERSDAKRKLSDKDRSYFEQAEKYLYTEFSIALNKTIDETKQYIINTIENNFIHE